MSDEWRWPHFTPDELRCHGDGTLAMAPDFMDRLELLRERFNRPMVIVSGYRSPAYNAKVSFTGEDGPHTSGHAVDVRVAGADALALVALALQVGFTGIGIKQHGAFGERYIHLDDLDGKDGKHPRPTLWSYP